MQVDSMRLTLLLLTVLGLVQACSQDETEIRELLKIRVANDYLAPYLAGDVDRWLQVFADDALAIYEGRRPLVGKRAIRAHAEQLTADFRIEQMDVSVEEVRLGSGWAWTRGTYQATFVPKTEAAAAHEAGRRHGNYVLLWERHGNGEWRIILDTTNDLAAHIE